MKTEYDVIIIGAGIGGLVCGCYLAKAGMKALIVEKNEKIGGCCTSFERDGFQFDACVHYLSSCRSEGQIGRLLNDLNINKSMKLKRMDPTDTVITNDKKFVFKNNLEETIECFQKIFFRERKNIRSFFDFASNLNINDPDNFSTYFLKLRNKTFKGILDYYFNDIHLKRVLGVIVGNLGLGSDEIGAFAAMFLYKEFILDGGYHPEGGVQKFSDILASKFRELGGVILLSSLVTKLSVARNKVTNVIVQKEKFLKSQYVVGACDFKNTLHRLIGTRHFPRWYINGISKMIPSSSVFGIYLGLNDKSSNILDGNYKGCLWYTNNSYNNYDLSLSSKPNEDLILCVFGSKIDNPFAENKSTCYLAINTPFINKIYWDKNKFLLSERIIRKMEGIIGGFSKHIISKTISTPVTLQNYTSNYRGAAYGWASTISQTNSTLIPQKAPLDNLYLCGHWITSAAGQGGIPMVVYSGRRVADLILKNRKRR